jgi:GrpB-like predicted nucleotidyltransferase (UPF0157 family)
VDLLDLYSLVAGDRGVEPEDLPLPERTELTQRALQVIWPGFEQVAPLRTGDHVEVVTYCSDWPERFREWRGRLSLGLGPAALRIDHVGSTSVPDLAAKPIIDIQLSVADAADEATYLRGCRDAGFELYSRDDAHRFFHVPSPSPRVAHLHVCQAGGQFERDHLLFRDYLRSHADECEAYAAVKRSAVLRWGDDRIGYTYAKNGFILECLERALEWATATAWSVEHGES